jgi:hypothetical protein
MARALIPTRPDSVGGVHLEVFTGAASYDHAAELEIQYVLVGIVLRR